MVTQPSSFLVFLWTHKKEHQSTMLHISQCSLLNHLSANQLEAIHISLTSGLSNGTLARETWPSQIDSGNSRPWSQCCRGIYKLLCSSWSQIQVAQRRGSRLQCWRTFRHRNLTYQHQQTHHTRKGWCSNWHTMYLPWWSWSGSVLRAADWTGPLAIDALEALGLLVAELTSTLPLRFWAVA